MKQILIDARKLIEKPENWTKGVFARNKAGVPVWTSAPDACSFCAIGAIAKVNGASELWERESLGVSYLNKVCQKKRGMELAQYNNSRYVSHADILRLFDTAIESAA
jgi:hypothetical protein